MSNVCRAFLTMRYSARMPKREPAQPPKAFPSLPAEAALSFLKDTKGALTWSARNLAETLNIDRREAEQALAFLEAQGYVQPAHKKKSTTSEWMTSPAGEAVSGAKSPRFTRESVEQALTALQERIKRNNKDPQAPFRVSDAVAFGDFLLPDRARVQAADVGIRLTRPESTTRRNVRNSKSHNVPPVPPRSASEAQAERKFLRDLRAKSAHLNLRPYADWMRLRSHRSLLSH
jgi:DNA-binding transcriptional MocR family regulator